MSVDLGVYVVDWDACLRLLERADDAEETWEQLAEGRVNLEYEDAEGLQRFSDYYDLCKQQGLKAWMPTFEESLKVVCWTVREDGKKTQELGFQLDPDAFPIDSSWTPATTLQLRDSWLSAKINDFQSIEIEDGGFAFRDFEEYHSDWVSVFDKASSERKGILVAVWG